MTVVDAHNYSTFPPLLFEAAVGVIVPEDVARPARSFLGRPGHTTFRLGEAVAIDWERRHIELADGDELPFDSLFLAPGVVPWHGAVPGAAEHAVPVKTLTDPRASATRAAPMRSTRVRSRTSTPRRRSAASAQAAELAIEAGQQAIPELHHSRAHPSGAP